MSTFTWTPSYPARKAMKPRVRVAPFGDGYEQRIGDGINSLLRVLQIRFENFAISDIDDIEAFLEARNGAESFDWTDPSGHAGKWVCAEWSRDDEQPAYASLSASFREVPA